MSTQPFLSKRSNRWSLFALTLLALLALLVMWRSASGAMRMKAQAAGTAQYLAFKSGSIAKIVIQVTAQPADHEMRGTLLEKQDETHYRHTSTAVRVLWNEQTAVLMGHRSDVRTHAILHVTGTMEDDRALKANQLVILTEYVTVLR